ncbi:hypothetical protein EJ06DRAFT_56852 [Trichodelitschia bisporula]|uniref:Uncharacterized protein n=1 Tax=Trichodelitschia bisporula TaxID=703511 RepID=A0A6G1HUL2_9PEZI|nr:hypothetical protein EJ06DRAFT_56852 [Trichodelitschia bisporula]
MADGLNEARAMRVAELMWDFRNLQHYMTQVKMDVTPEEYYLEGYMMLRACVSEAQAVLASQYANPATHPRGNLEAEKEQLRGVIRDACVRRFQCQKAYLRTLAVQRWIDSRQAILKGQRAHAGLMPHLQALDNQLRAEVAAVTDEHVDYSLRAQDSAQGKWIAEDPPLAVIQQHLHSG